MVAGANMTTAPQAGMVLVNGISNSATVNSTNEQIKKTNSDNRRSNKPIMEKRRRARINNCLNELKTIILDAMKKDPARHSKLEKADILEMTVRHLESLQRQQSALATAADPGVMNKFRAGYSSCAGEVGRFPGLDPQVRRRLMQHLAACLVTSTAAAAANQKTDTSAKSMGDFSSVDGCESNTNQVHILPAPVIDVNNTTIPAATSATPGGLSNNSQQQQPPIQLTAQPNGGIYFTTANGQGVQLIPTRLPNGDIALILPGNSPLPPAQKTPQNYAVAQPSQHQVSPSQGGNIVHQNQTSVIMPNLIAIPCRTDSTHSAHSLSNQSSSSSGTFSPVASPALSYESPPTPPKSSHNGETPERMTSFSPDVLHDANHKPVAHDVIRDYNNGGAQVLRCKSAESLMHTGEDATERLRHLNEVADRYSVDGVREDQGQYGKHRLMVINGSRMERESSPQSPLSLVMRRPKSYKAAAVAAAAAAAQDDNGSCWRPW